MKRREKLVWQKKKGKRVMRLDFSLKANGCRVTACFFGRGVSVRGHLNTAEGDAARITSLCDAETFGGCSQAVREESGVGSGNGGGTKRTEAAETGLKKVWDRIAPEGYVLRKAPNSFTQ